jgi:hypothetical protein
MWDVYDAVIIEWSGMGWTSYAGTLGAVSPVPQKRFEQHYRNPSIKHSKKRKEKRKKKKKGENIYNTNLTVFVTAKKSLSHRVISLFVAPSMANRNIVLFTNLTCRGREEKRGGGVVWWGEV